MMTLTEMYVQGVSTSQGESDHGATVRRGGLRNAGQPSHQTNGRSAA